MGLGRSQLISPGRLANVKRWLTSS
jgi:hypothetical protein